MRKGDGRETSRRPLDGEAHWNETREAAGSPAGREGTAGEPSHPRRPRGTPTVGTPTAAARPPPHRHRTRHHRGQRWHVRARRPPPPPPPSFTTNTPSGLPQPPATAVAAAADAADATATAAAVAVATVAAAAAYPAAAAAAAAWVEGADEQGGRRSSLLVPGSGGQRAATGRGIGGRGRPVLPERKDLRRA